MSEINQDEFVALFNFVPIQQAFEIAKYIDNLVDQEKRSTAIAYTKWAFFNAYWMPSKERWYLHRPEDCNWIPGGRTDEELYDYYLSLPK